MQTISRKDHQIDIPPDIGHYLSGFAHGEGSFMIVFRKRKDFRQTFKVSAAFNVSQKDREILNLYQKYWGCGTIRKAGNDGYYFEVNNLQDIRSTVIPFFKKYQLRATKRRKDFERFTKIVKIISSNQHRTHEGIKEILTLREGMNNGGKRKYSIDEILRDHMPNASRSSQLRG